MEPGTVYPDISTTHLPLHINIFNYYQRDIFNKNFRPFEFINCLFIS